MKPPRIRPALPPLLNSSIPCAIPPRPLSRCLSTTPLLHARLRPTKRRPQPPREATQLSSEPSPESLYAHKMDMPVINIFEAESTTSKPRLTDRITTWSQLAAKRKELARKEAELEQTLEEYENEADDASVLAPGALVPLRTRILAAERDEGHRAAMKALRVRVEGPKVAQLNAVLKMAYVGANAQVGRELWRAYLGAKSVEGVLQAIPDGAWDLLWYSQAAVRKGRGGGEARLAVLREDLKSVGRSGPPTPETAVEGMRREMEEGEEESEEVDLDKMEAREEVEDELAPEDKHLEKLDEGMLKKAIADLKRRIKLRDSGHEGPI